MTDFPTILYRVPGRLKKPRGGTYSTVGANDQTEFDVLIDKGWFASYDEAANKLKPKAADVDDTSAPTRDEMETMAKELDVSFNARTSDITLLNRINSALEA